MGIPESDVGDVYVDALMKVHGNIHKFKVRWTGQTNDLDLQYRPNFRGARPRNSAVAGMNLRG
jgi:hypothetical protein